MNCIKLSKATGLACLALMLISIPLLGAGCGSDSEDTVDKVKVGFSICYTGVAAEKGRPMGNAKLDCIKYINEELGGVAGYEIEVIWRDNEYDAAKATTIINELIDAGCLMFTTNSSAMMTASAETANREDFPGFAVFSAPALTNPPQHIYAQMPDYGDDWAAFANYYLENIWQGEGEPKMALHLLNNSTGAGAKAAADLLADDLGIDLVTVEEHDASTISEIDSLTRIMALDPDVLYISSTPQPTSIILKDAVDLGLYPGVTVGLGHASITDELVELAGADVVEGVYGVYPTVNWGDDVPAMDKMTEYCQQYHPEDYGNMDYITSWAEGLIVAEILRLAIENVGIENLTPQAVEEHGFKALNNFNVGGLHGPVTYTAGDNRLSKSVRVFQISGGEIMPITGWIDAPQIPYVFD
ncbi:MAG TPA: ABC transporter substrate-binding protein [Dehalococcoidia bacterium]|nr:ABC transporter substrate-binding protein [Dehalococcoidia bacterium]